MDEESKGIFSCRGMSWITGALLGFAAYLLLRGRWETGFLLALIVALAVLVAAALLLQAIFCREVEETEGGYAAMAAKRSAERKQYEAERAAAREEKAEAAAEAEAEAEAKTAAEAAAEAEKVAEAAAEAERAVAEAERAAAAEKAAAAAAEAEKAVASRAAAKPAAPASDGRPEALDGPREGGADDLKMIKGVGPKLEQLLHSLGIYHFDQIAGWGEAEIAWMDDNLKGFRGRVSRDEWVKQAKILAEGGTTEFAQKVKKGDVY